MSRRCSSEATIISNRLARTVALLGATTLTVTAATAHDGAGVPAAASLQLQPALCALAREERLCRKDVQIAWQLPEQASPCLHRSDLSEALHCWQQQSDGSIAVQVESASDLVFVLKAGEHTLAEAVFRVLWEEQQRRKRRKPWQFF